MGIRIIHLGKKGGSGGTSNYNELSNRPKINNKLLTGNKTSSQLGLSDEFQFATLPVASSSLEGVIYQYIGATDENYTNGHFYKCVSDGQDPATYSWSEVSLGSGGSSFNIHSLTEENTLADADELAIYDISASAHRKTTWSNLITKISTALSSVFAAISHTHTKSQITDFPAIPSALSDLTEDATHRTVTDTEKSTWNGKGTYSKPAGGIPASDLASGVIPSVPAIDSSIDSQSVNTDVAGAKAVYDALNPTMTVNTTDASVSVALNCDKTYKYMLSSGVTSLTVTALNTAPNDGAEHLYRLKFRSGATATQFTPPAGTIYLDGEVPTIKTNTVYEVTWDTDMCMTVVAFAAVSE